MLRIAYWLNIRRLKRRPLRVFLAVVSVASGVSLAVSVLIMNSSVTSTLESFGRQLAGPAPLRIIGATSSGGIQASALTAVEHTEGVAAAIPMVQAVAYAEGPGDHVTKVPVVALGVDCRVQALVGRFGCTTSNLTKLASTGEPLVSTSLAHSLGQGSIITTDHGSVPIQPQSTLAELDAINGGHVAVFALPAAQRLFDRQDHYDVINVIPTPGTNLTSLRSRLIRSVGGWNGVLSASAPPPAEAVFMGSIIPIFALLSLFALGVGAVLIFNVMSLAFEERRRELAIIAAIGGSAGSVRAGAATEGGLLGLAGGLLGVAGGALLARPLTSSVSSFTRVYAGVSIHVHLTTGAVLTGALLGALIGAASAVLPTRKAMRMDVAAELSMRGSVAEAAPRPQLRRGLVLLGICLAGVVLSWFAQRNGGLDRWQADAAPIGTLVATVGYLLAAGSFTALIATAVFRLWRDSDGPLRLGLANLAREGRRAGVITIAIGAAVATAFVTGSVHSSAKVAIAKGIESGHPPEVYVSPLGPNNAANVEAKPDPTLVSSLGRLPGVAAVDQSFFVLTGHTSSDLVGVSAYTDTWFNLPLVMGTDSPSYFNSGHVLIGTTLARSRHLRPGSNLVLDTPTGFASVTVGGIWWDGTVSGNAVTMPLSLFQRLFGDLPPQSVGLLPAPGVTPVRLANEVTAAHLQPGLTVETPAQLARSLTATVGQQLAPFNTMQRALLLVAFVAILSTLLLVGVQRRREMGLLAAVGMEPAQLAGMTVSEGAGAGVIGVVLSIVGSIISAICFALVLPISFGYQDPLRFDFASLAIWGPITVVLAAAATLLPAWRNSRLPIVETLQYE